MLKRCLPLVLVMVLVQPGQAAVYTIISDPGIGSDYSYSGTLTTDGSIGTFSVATAITDWNINITTPGGVDGVVSQVLTPATSTKFHFPQGVGDIVITATSISILNSGVDNTTNLAFSAPTGESFTLEGPKSTTLTGFVSVSDVNEVPPYGSALIGDVVSAQVAYRIPEPGAASLSLLGLLALSGAVAHSRSEN